MSTPASSASRTTGRGTRSATVGTVTTVTTNTAFHCPGCGQALHYTAYSGTECGGEGEGACAITHYAFDTLRDPAAALADWRDLHDDAAPPSAALAEVVRRVHESAAADAAAAAR